MTLIALFSLLATPTAEAKGKPSSISFPADFELQSCWGFETMDPGCPWTENVMYADGTFEQTVLHFPGYDPIPYIYEGSWALRKGGKELVITFVTGEHVQEFVGTRAADGCFEGTATLSYSEQTAVWEGCVVE